MSRKFQHRRSLQVQVLENRQLLAAELFLQDELAVSTFGRAGTFGDALLYQRTEEATGAELWISPGDGASPTLLKDLAPGPDSSFPRNFVSHGDLAFFSTLHEGNVFQLWRTDGTADGTIGLTDPEIESVGIVNLTFESQPFEGGVLAWRDNGETEFSRLWIHPVDGAQPIELSRQAPPDSRLSSVITTSKSILFKQERDGQTQGFWISDGTDTGTHPIRDVGNVPITSINRMRRVHEVNDGVLALLSGTDNFSQLVHINRQGQTTLWSDHEDIQQVSRVEYLRDGAVVTAQGLFHIDGFGNASRITLEEEFRVVTGVVAFGNDFLFQYLGDGGNRLGHYEVETKIATALEQAIPGINGFPPVIIDDAVFYATRDANDSEQVISFQFDINQSIVLATLADNQSVSRRLAAGNQFVFAIESPTETVIHAVDADGTPVLEYRISRDNNPGRHSIFPVFGNQVVVKTPTEFGIDTVALNTATGAVVALDSTAPVLNAAFSELFSEVQFGDSLANVALRQLTVTDGTLEGTTKINVPADLAGTATRPRAVQNTLYFSLEEINGHVARLSQDSLTPEYFPVPRINAIEATDTGVIFLAGDDVWKWDLDAPKPMIVVSDYPSLGEPPVFSGNLSEGDNPFANRVAYVRNGNLYASDGTLAGTGVVDTHEAIVQRLTDAGIEASRVSLTARGGAFYARATTDDGTLVLLERPGQQGLQPFEPFSYRFTSVFLHPPDASGWYIRDIVNPDDRRLWKWRHDRPVPDALEVANHRHQSLHPFKDRTIVRAGRADCDSCTDLFVFSQDSSQSFFADANLDKEARLAGFLGIVEQNAIVGVFDRSVDPVVVNHFIWDVDNGTVQPVPTLDVAAKQVGRNFTRVEQTTEAFFARGSSAWYRVPLDAETLAVNAPDLVLNVNPARLNVESNGQPQISRSWIAGELLSIDAGATSESVLLDLDDWRDLPVNGLQLNLADQTTLNINSAQGVEKITYQWRDDQLVVTVQDRPVYLTGAELQVVDSINAKQRVLNLSADDDRVDVFTVDEKSFVDIRNQHRITLGFPAELERMVVLPDDGSNAISIDESFVGTDLLEIRGDLDPSRINRISVPDRFEHRGVQYEQGRTVFMAADGVSEIWIDASETPFQNVFRRFDANRDGFQMASDALTVINLLGTQSVNALALARARGFLPDVNGDGMLSALDALLIINHLIEIQASAEEQSVDAVFDQWLYDDEELAFDEHMTIVDSLLH